MRAPPAARFGRWLLWPALLQLGWTMNPVSPWPQATDPAQNPFCSLNVACDWSKLDEEKRRRDAQRQQQPRPIQQPSKQERPANDK